MSSRPAHLFKPGQSGNPKGRPKGTRVKLSKLFLDSWLKCMNEKVIVDGQPSTMGIESIRQVLREEPAKAMAIVSQIVNKFDLQELPPGTTWVINANPGMSVEEWQKHALEASESHYGALEAETSTLTALEDKDSPRAVRADDDDQAIEAESDA